MDIPEDVMKAANEAAADWFKAIGKSEYHFADAIARAILAERERCADVAENKARDLKVNDLSARMHGAAKEAEGYAYASDRCLEVADTIRATPNQTGEVDRT